MSGTEGPHLFESLARLGCNPVQELFEGMSHRGLMNIIFPNGEAMFGWFKGLAESGLKGLSPLSIVKVTLPTWGSGNIASPIGVPHVEGLLHSRQGR
jgi:hypothetical protein